MLFTIIRDFFVQHVWGGYDSQFQPYSPFIGQFFNQDFNLDQPGIAEIYVPVGKNLVSSLGDEVDMYISLGDWLSTTSTIITMVVILVCIAFFIRWLFKVVSNSILLR